MKRMTNHLMTAAAVLMIGAGAASAQSSLKAEIPFAFSAGRKVTEPGTYKVKALPSLSSIITFEIRNMATGDAFLLVTNVGSDVPKHWLASGTPRMEFECGSGACALSKIWMGEGTAHRISGPRKKSGEVQLSEIVLKSDKGD